MARTFWVETLGCPKNQVDSDKLVGTMLRDGLSAAAGPESADLIVVNTCAFIEQARQESIDTILELDGTRQPGAELVVTGCLAERYGTELQDAMPEIDQVAGFGVAVTIGRGSALRPTAAVPSFDLLNLPRPKSNAPWAYVKIAEGCDRNCGFCAIPSFRGKQRSRSVADVLAEIEALEVQEVVLVAQDLAAYGRDQGKGDRQLVALMTEATKLLRRVRLLYLYPSDLTDTLIDAVLETGVAYFDLSLQHVSAPLMRRMRRWGDGAKFTKRIADIRTREPQSAFRSNFIVGYPGETEEDHDELLRFVRDVELDWCGFFEYSPEAGTYAMELDGVVPSALISERLAELRELQDSITARRRDALVGITTEVLVDAPGEARSFREAPEIDGIIEVPANLLAGTFVDVQITEAVGPDLVGRLVK